MKTKRMTTTALLTALAIIIPLVMPIKILFPGFTATLASHTPLIIAMFIGPVSAVIVALGSAVGFLFAFPDPLVATRAAMHVIFVLVGALMLRKRMNLYLVIAVTLVLHTLSDMATVYVVATLFNITAFLKGESMAVVQAVIGGGTSLHHIVDFLIALVIVTPLQKAFPDLFVPFGYGLQKK